MWQRKVGDALAEPLSRRTPLSAEQVRALSGALLFALSGGEGAGRDGGDEG